MSAYHDVLDSARGLPPEERVQLMVELWDSVSPEDWPQPSDAWMEEVQRRSKLIDEGRMSTAPWSEVKERVRRKAGLDD